MRMWVLRSAAPSPYGRKVRIAAAVCGLSDRITVVETDTRNPDDPIRRENPLGKIPTLMLEDGTALFDSRVIVEFFDVQAGGGVIIPPPGSGRFEVLAMQALADGINDAALLQVYEGRFREPEMHGADWLAHQAGKVARGLEAFESAPPPLSQRPHIGQIALASALGYQDLRFEGAWRTKHPRLVAWLDEFASMTPSFEATRVR
jgi:glutathione S-transferase